jgi:tetratricopeptide (TPR) repeat protein
MSMSRLIRHGLSAAACSVGLLLLPVSPVASEERGRAGAALGDVHFPTSCTPAAQQQFDRAVAILHSFWYEEAVKAFTGVTRTDPSCAMGYWGVAMSHWYPLWYPPGEDALKAGSSAAEQARAVGAKTPRERDYVAAVAAFYEDWGKLDHRTRSLAYEKAMEHVHATYPDDREAGVFYALALNATALPTDKTYANQLKAAAILEKVFAEQPSHPGVAHYLIHSYDTPTLAERGLPAARRYASVAPAVPHALHMPSHIFTRLGFWQEAIASNRAAHEAARAYAERTIGPSAWDQETLHTLDYLAYAHLQMAQDRAAKRVVDDLATFRQGPASLPAAYAAAAIPSRYALERRSWHEAARLSSPGIPFPLERFPWAEAMLAFTRALGAAHTGDLVTAQAEIARLGALKEKLTQAKNTYWANLVEAQRLGASAVASRTRGEGEEAVELARAAADLEDSMDKHPATPAAVLPARELYADLLLELGDPSEALGEYARSLETNPHRFRSLLGIARSSKQSGDSSRARDAYQELLELSGEADTERPELMEARAFLTN